LIAASYWLISDFRATVEISDPIAASSVQLVVLGVKIDGLEYLG
jgi:hypothetical protein